MGNFEWDSCVTQSIGMDFPLTSVGRNKFHVSLLVCFFMGELFFISCAVNCQSLITCLSLLNTEDEGCVLFRRIGNDMADFTVS